jgi:hypothetical protein
MRPAVTAKIDPRSASAKTEPSVAAVRARCDCAGGFALRCRVIDLAAVVRMIPVQPDLPRIGRIGVGQPERTARRYRVRVADRTREPVPGLAAADRAAHRIMPDLGRDRAIAPRAQSGHARPPVPRSAADSNGDSNSSSHRLTEVGGRGAAYPLENRRLILAASTLRPPGTRLGPWGRMSRAGSAKVVDGCPSGICAGAAARYSPPGRAGACWLGLGRRAPMPSDRGCRRWRPGRRR